MKDLWASSSNNIGASQWVCDELTVAMAVFRSTPAGDCGVEACRIAAPLVSVCASLVRFVCCWLASGVWQMLVWCFLWHFWHLRLDLQAETWCLPRQLKHNLFLFTTAIRDSASAYFWQFTATCGRSIAKSILDRWFRLGTGFHCRICSSVVV